MSKPTSDRAAISRVINGLIEAGCTPTVARDCENEDMEYAGNTKTAILDHLTSGDESVLFVDLPEGAGRESSHVYFVLGNEPYEVVSDHGVSLTPYIDPITAEWDED
jgi:hypothetical protein